MDVEDGIITDVRVVRGASCEATWEAGRKLIGKTAADGPRQMGLEAQFFCSADPAGWDPIYGKSPVHFAGKVHSKALASAIEDALGKKK